MFEHVICASEARTGSLATAVFSDVIFPANYFYPERACYVAIPEATRTRGLAGNFSRDDSGYSRFVISGQPTTRLVVKTFLST